MYCEIKARIANLISLIFCVVAISANYHWIMTLFVVVLAVIEAIHTFFGDITKSYRLLRNRIFFRVYATSLILFFITSLLAFFIVNLNGRISLLSIAIAFISNFIADNTRNRELKNKK